MDLILTLALATFVLLIAFLLWNRASTKRHQESGGHPDGNALGIGGLADPLSGVAEGMRHPDEMRADLDTASATDAIPPRPLR
jgi:hypothetical protein